MINTNAPRYKIVFHWEALQTGATGHGPVVEYIPALADKTVDDLNRDNKGFTRHWWTFAPAEQPEEIFLDPGTAFVVNRDTD